MQERRSCHGRGHFSCRVRALVCRCLLEARTILAPAYSMCLTMARFAGHRTPLDRVAASASTPSTVPTSSGRMATFSVYDEYSRTPFVHASPAAATARIALSAQQRPLPAAQTQRGGIAGVCASIFRGCLRSLSNRACVGVWAFPAALLALVHSEWSQHREGSNDRHCLQRCC